MVTQELHNTIDLSAPVAQILFIYERDIALNTGEIVANEVARAGFPFADQYCQRPSFCECPAQAVEHIAMAVGDKRQ